MTTMYVFSRVYIYSHVYRCIYIYKTTQTTRRHTIQKTQTAYTKTTPINIYIYIRPLHHIHMYTYI